MIKLRLGLLLVLIFSCFNSFCQIQQANLLLGKNYDTSFEDSLKDYNYKIFKNKDSIVYRVDICVSLEGNYKDFVNDLLNHYKSNSDSILYTKEITKEFCFDDLEYNKNESVMFIFSGKFAYVFVINRKKITLEHYLND